MPFRYTFRVAKHKTRKKYGPANVTLRHEDWLLLKIFVDDIRTQLPVQDETVFLSWSGKEQKSGEISNRLHNLWLKAGMFNLEDSSRLNSNKIRKSAATELRKKNDPRLQEAADCMAHSVATADNHYFVRKMEKSSAVGSSAITEVFYKPKTTPVKKKKQWSQAETQQIIQHFSPLKDVTMDDVRNSPFKIGSDKEVLANLLLRKSNLRL